MKKLIIVAGLLLVGCGVQEVEPRPEIHTTDLGRWGYYNVEKFTDGSNTCYIMRTDYSDIAGFSCVSDVRK